MFAVESLRRDRAVYAEGPDVLLGLPDVRGVRIQTLDHVAIIDSQAGREPAVAASDVHDQPALDTGLLDDLRWRRRL